MKGYGKIWIIPLAALLCACSNGNDTAQPVRSVYVTQPVKISNERVKSYPGIVKAAEEINLGFKTAGQNTCRKQRQQSVKRNSHL